MYFYLYYIYNNIFYDSAKTTCLGKIWFFSYALNCLDLDIWHEDNHQGNIGYETTTFGWLWPVVPCPIKLQDSLIINIPRKNRLMS